MFPCIVYVRKDKTEEVTDFYRTSRNGLDGVVIETEDRYFEYFFPIKEAPEYVDSDYVLSAYGDMTITEAPEEVNESQFTGKSGLTVPKCVVEKAEELTGYPLPE